MTIAPRFLPVLVLVSSLAVLGGAFAFQYAGGLDPCALCVYQRYPYGVAIGLSLLAMVVGIGRPTAVLLVLCGLVFLAGTGIAGFHVGVEQAWWAGLSSCAGGGLDPDASLQEVLRGAAAEPAARCDEVPWSLFGISMAGFNVLISLGLAGLSLSGAWRMRRAVA